MGLFSSRHTTAPQEQQGTKLVVVTGCAGSGKTTVGRALARRLNWAYVDKDTVTRGFTDFILERLGSSAADRESELYRTEILPVEYAVTFKVVGELLEYGSDVVCTVPFVSQIGDWSAWERIRDEAHIARDVDARFIWIEHDIGAERRNIDNRNALRDGWKRANWDAYAASVKGIEPAPEYKAYVHVNDIEVPLQNAIDEIVDSWLLK